jgi:hypothetical protein
MRTGRCGLPENLTNKAFGSRLAIVPRGASQTVGRALATPPGQWNSPRPSAEVGKLTRLIRLNDADGDGESPLTGFEARVRWTCGW